MKELGVFKQFAKKGKGTTLRTDGKAVIYTRVSTKEQAENNASLQTQLKYCKELAASKDLEVVEYFGGTYESAKSDERKEFKRMLSFVKRRNNIGYIIVYSYDRFSRTGANGAYISDQLKKQGIVTISATQQVDTSTSAGSFQQNLYYMFSQFDNEIRRDKSVSGMQEKLRKGYWTGAYPFGYSNHNPGKGKIPEFYINQKGKLLRLAFLWKADLNLPNTEIAKRLEKKGLEISRKKLTNIFRNPFYCGLIVSNMIPGEVIQGNHPPLVSRAVFLKIHKLLHSKATPIKYNSTDAHLPLKSFLKSTSCGSPYTGYIVKRKGLYYYKNGRIGSKENRSAKLLHQEFIQTLSQYQLRDAKLIAPLKEIIRDTFLKINAEQIYSAKRISEQINSLQEKIDRLEERFVFEEITKTQYDKFKLKIAQEIDSKTEVLLNNNFKESNLEKAINLALNYALNLPSLWESGDIETKRAIQYMVFPDGLGYDFKNKQVRTSRVNQIFKAINCFSEELEQNKNGNSKTNFENSRLVLKVGTFIINKRK